MSPETAAPVLVLNSGHHGGLGVVRSLGRMGVPVHTVDAEAKAPTAYSRYCRSHLRWDFDAAPPAESIDFLIDAAERLGKRPILIPTSDTTALFSARHATRLQQRFVFPDQQESTASSLADKASLFGIAKAHGIPTPETFFPQSKEDLDRFLVDARFPLMLKAINYGLLRDPGIAPKCIVGDRGELLTCYRRMQDSQRPNLVIQEYIPGGDDCIWMFNGYFDSRSECLFGMTGKKIRQFPVHTGVSSLAICLRNDVVRETTLRWMKALGYRGILDIGYRYDHRDGQYKVLDVNPRIGSTFRLFVGDDGMDVVRALYLDLTGQRVPGSSVPEGRKWIVEDYDLVSSFRYFREGSLTLREWLASFSGIRETAVFSLSDPLPAWRILAHESAVLVGHLLSGGRETTSDASPRGDTHGGEMTIEQTKGADVR